MRMRMVRRGGLVGLAAVAALLIGGTPASAAAGDASAFGVKVSVKLLGADLVSAGPFAEASTGGQPESTFVGVDLPGILKTGVITASASRDEATGQVGSRASIADVNLGLLKPAGGAITATVIEASCTAVQKGVSGAAKLAGISLGGLGKVPVEPAPNTKIAVGLLGVNIATIIFNEQVKNADGSLTVNAVHLKLLGGVAGSLGDGDIILASATCGPAGLPIPLASGAGLWISIGVLGAVAVPAALVARRRRPTATVLA